MISEAQSKLIYICSRGHSGSTLLDVVVGACVDCFSCGELQYLGWQLRRAVTFGSSLENENVCSCGLPFLTCEIWGRVLHVVRAESGPKELRRTVILGSQDPNDAELSLHRLIFLAYRHALIDPSLKWFSSIVGSMLATATRRSWRLIDTISQESGCKYVVDSSKELVRFELLRRSRPADCYLLVLFRDVWGNAWSAIRRGANPVKAAIASKRQASFVFSYLSQHRDVTAICITYKELCRDPGRVRNMVSALTGCENEARDIFGSDQDQRDRHLVAGNPARFKGMTTIEFDEGESHARSVLSAESIRQIEVLASETEMIIQKIAHNCRRSGEA